MHARVRKAVNAEKTSRTYAEQYYEGESGNDAFFALDTAFLDARCQKKGFLVDMMMGRGRHVLHFAAKGYKVHGNDHNAHMVRSVRRALAERGLSATLSARDAVSLPVKNADYVISMYSSLGCVPTVAKRQRILRAAARIARPGGLVIVHGHSLIGTCLHVLSLREVIDVLFPPRDLERGDHLYEHEVLGPTYIHYFLPGELQRMFRRAGLDVVEVAHVHRSESRVCGGLFPWLRSTGLIVVGRKQGI